MSELTCQAESEVSALVRTLRKTIAELDEAHVAAARFRLVTKRREIQERLGERAAVLLPVLLDELRTLRQERK